jgi:integrative and conjugative element protein (TIGR02256 family)
MASHGSLARLITHLVLSQRARDQIDSDILAHPDVETGGLLPGRIISNAMIVPFTIAAGPNAARARARYAPDVTWQQEILDHAFANFACVFGGAWHRHPGQFDVPSGVDLKTARHIVTEIEWDTEQAVFPIAIVRDGRVLVRAFLMRRDATDFVEVPIEVVPNDDPRVLQVLAGTPVARVEV